MEKYGYLQRLLFGGVACVAAGGLAWRCCARRQRDPAATGATEGDAASSTAVSSKAEEQPRSCPGSPAARAAQRREAAGPRPRPPAAGDGHGDTGQGSPGGAAGESSWEPEREAPAGAAAAAAAPGTAPQESEGGSADSSGLGRAAAALPAAAAASPAGAAPAAGPASAALPFRSAGKWQPKRLRAESCPEDFVSEQQRREEKAAADDLSLIQPQLYLSSYLGTAAKDTLQKAGVTTIVCLDAELKSKYPASFTYKVIDLQDDEYADALARLPEAMAAILQAQQSGGGALVHCQKGRSRSATVVLAWLIVNGGSEDLRRAWSQVHGARPMICPNRAFKRQLLRLQQMARTAGDNFDQHALYAFHQAELSLISTKPAAEVQDSPHCVDPAEYSKQEQCAGGEGAALKGLVCSTCGRVVSSPLNLLWVGGAQWNAPVTGPAASGDGEHMPAGPDAISELAHGAVTAAGEVLCLGCGTKIGSRCCCPAAVALAYEHEPDSGAWQVAAGGLAAGAPEQLLPQWCALLDRGRTRLAMVAPLPCGGGDAH